MSRVPTPSIFESINARALKPTQVAQTFVPPAQFDLLIKRRNTVIVGPRGSGKTTMLKMLQQPALEAWDHPRAEEYRARIDYSAAFIATDVSWGAQVKALGEGRLDPETHRRLGIAAFTTHVLRAIVSSMLARNATDSIAGSPSYRRVNLDDATEAVLVREMAAAWQVKPAIPSLQSLKQAMSRRLSDIREFASREVVLGEAGRTSRVADTPYLHLHFLQSAALGVELFSDSVGEPDGKWALLFDELELAPDWIREELMRSLRGADERFLLKLALSPFSQEVELMESVLAAAPGHDYDQIPLWYAQKQEGYPFCEKLWYGMLRERGLPERSPKQVLGASYFETPDVDWKRTGTAYGPGSRLGKLFIEMAKRDASFRNYLERKSIDPRLLHKIPAGSRAADIRKVAPLLPVREFYRAADDVQTGLHNVRSRSRKQATLYAGADSLFAITEGNPRWFIGIVDALLDHWRLDANKISAAVQADEMVNAAQRFSALLRTIPLPAGVHAGTRTRGLLTIINDLGRYFHEQVVTRQFMAEPPGAFIVDSHAPDDILQMLAQALNAGALVYVPEDRGQILLKSLKGKRFRLSYLLAPIHRTPIRLGRAVALSRALTSNARSMWTEQIEFDGGLHEKS